MIIIKELRVKSKISQEELANKIGVGQSTVSMWETGESNPRMEMLPRLAEVLGCEIGDLFAKDGA